MIDVAQYKIEIAALPGDSIIVPRAQIHELLAEVETGQRARRALSSLKTMAAIAASTTGIAA